MRTTLVSKPAAFCSSSKRYLYMYAKKDFLPAGHHLVSSLPLLVTEAASNP